MANNISGMPPAPPMPQSIDTRTEATAAAGTSASTNGRPTLSTRDFAAPSATQASRQLHQAAAKGDRRALLEALIGAMDQVNQVDPLTGRTPLEAALESGHHDAAQLLMDAGARVHAVAPKYLPARAPLYAAAEAGNPDLLAAALASSTAVLNQPDPVSGLTPLMFAIRSKNPQAVDMLLQAGARPDQVDAAGRPPIMQAAGSGNTAVLALLLKNGAPVDQPDRAGSTALMAAAGNSNPELAALLVAHGADVDHVQSNGATALFQAVMTCRTETVRLLLDHHADAGRADHFGRRPLEIAMQLGYTEGAALLRAHMDE